MIFMEERTFEVEEEQALAQLPKEHDRSPSEPLPLCSISDEAISPNASAGIGRWVREAWPTADECTPYEDVDTKKGPVSQKDPNNPRCWWRTDMTRINRGCLEMNCQLINKESKWNTSALQHEHQFNAVWRNYQCDYLEFSDAQLSTCFRKKKIKEFRASGASISAMLNAYIDVQLANVEFFKGSTGKKVTVSTIKWPHLLWHGSGDHWREKVNAMPDEEESYWLTPMFTSSEREPYVQFERGLDLIDVVEPILRTKGYHMINMMDPTAAMTVRTCCCCSTSTAFLAAFLTLSFLQYDTATQKDGLHIVGPPFKYAIKRVFHHMCADIVEGTRA